MNKGKIVIISGPSGSGKTTLYKKLLASKRLAKRLVKSISMTTRLPRRGEKHGRDYLFIDKTGFLAKKRAGHFLESQKVFENYYGTPKQNVEELLDKGQNVLLCIDVKGARVVGQQYPDAVTIFITVPSLVELKKRLNTRGSESEKDFNLRMRTARKELQQVKRYKHVVINDDLKKAYRKLENIVCQELTLCRCGF